METEGGGPKGWYARTVKGSEIPAGQLLLLVILPSTETVPKGAGPLMISFPEQAFLPIMIYEDHFLNMVELV